MVKAEVMREISVALKQPTSGNNALDRRTGKTIPMAEKLMGINTVSGFLAEVGDTRCFSSPKELQKLAWVD